MTEEQHHTIALQAYLLWEQEGYPDGRCLDHWLAAEHLVLAPPRSKKKTVVAKPKARRTAPAKKKSETALEAKL